jgi:DNA-binding MarR family transcriptional regulator
MVGRRRPIVPSDVRFGVGRLDELMTVQLRRADIHLSEAFYMATQREMLKSGVISSLALIVANRGISQNEISRQTGIDKSAMVTVIDALEANGWVVRRRSTEDRRRYSLFATPAGEEEFNNLIDAVKEIEDDLLARLSLEEIRKLRALLDRVAASCAQAEDVA